MFGFGKKRQLPTVWQVVKIKQEQGEQAAQDYVARNKRRLYQEQSKVAEMFAAGNSWSEIEQGNPALWSELNELAAATGGGDAKDFANVGGRIFG